MYKILLPYGKGNIIANIEENHLAGVIKSDISQYNPLKESTEIVSTALDNPIKSRKLSDLSVGKKKVVIISSDHTRPVPSKITMPLLLKEVRKGNPQAEIIILIATGLHRKTTKEELIEKFGPKIIENEKVVVHNCDDNRNLVSLGKLPSGGELKINRLAAEADLLVAEGTIEPHFFAGYSGGRKSILPGIAGREAVMYNHSSAFIDDKQSNTGVLEHNLIHEDMLYAARIAGLDFILNVVVDTEHRPIYAVAGDCEAAHAVGVQFIEKNSLRKAIPADIVISTNGGYPLDQNIYQSVKGMTAAEATVKPGGVIIMVSKAIDGHGGESFYKIIHSEPDLHKLMQDFLNRGPSETVIDQWQAQIIVRVLLKACVIFISSCPDELVRDMHMIPAHSVEEALKMAVSIIGRKDYKVTVIPDGVSVTVR